MPGFIEGIKDRINGTSHTSALPWRSEIVQASFRNIPFHVDETNTQFGRRTVVHEFPNQNDPLVEDLGEIAKVHNIRAYVIGENWEKKRNDLLKACRQGGKGILVHPEYGGMYAICSSCVITENKTESGMLADFDLTFVEVPDKDLKNAYVDTAERVRNKAKKDIGLLAKIFNAVYTITNLPQYCADYVSGQFQGLTGMTPFQAIGIVNAFKNLSIANITIPSEFSSAMNLYTSSINDDYADTHNGTKTISPKQALKIYLDDANKTVEYPSAITPTIAAQNQAMQQVEMFYKQCSVIQASVASTYIDFKSFDEANVIWNDIMKVYDEQIKLAADTGNNNGYLILRDSKANFVADIKVRAPALNKIMFKRIGTPTPGLVIAYDQYEDITREQEIIDRNNIKSPQWIMSNKLELLTE